jgi:WD40 repeat protein
MRPRACLLLTGILLAGCAQACTSGPADVRAFRPSTGESTRDTRDTGLATIAPEGLVVLQRNDRAWTFEEGISTPLGVVEPWDIDPSGRIVAFRFDQIWYSAPGTTNTVSFTRRDAVLVIDPSTERSLVLDEAAPNETFDGPARWSPDGSTVALWLYSYPAPLSEGHPGPNAGRAAVCLVSTTDGSRRCFPEAGHTVSLDWSGDGRKVLLAGLGGPIFTLDIRTGALDQLVDPSGGEEARRLLREQGLGAESVVLTEAWWSSSDRYVAASVYGAVPIIYSSAGGAVAVGSASNDAMPMAWSPSDDVLAYAVADGSLATGGSSRIHVLDPVGGDRVVADLSETAVAGVIGMTWSPDGQFVALNTFDGTWLLDPSVGVESLRRLDAPGAIVAWR